MYAVIYSGGRQYRVQKGDILKIESLPGDKGSSISFDKILMVGEGDSINLGKPYLKGCSVSATVVSQGRAKKIHIVKFGRRKHRLKWQGHRQNFTEIEITEIEGVKGKGK